MLYGEGVLKVGAVSNVELEVQKNKDLNKSELDIRAILRVDVGFYTGVIVGALLNSCIELLAYQ